MEQTPGFDNLELPPPLPPDDDAGVHPLPPPPPPGDEAEQQVRMLRAGLVAICREKSWICCVKKLGREAV